jgi:hypothetical protein
MKRYPLEIPLSTYGGSDPAKRRKESELYEVGKLVVDYINGEMAKWPEPRPRSFDRHEIARAVRADSDLVGNVLVRLDSSDNGVTVFKEEQQ